MKALRHAEITRPPSELLEAVARVYEPFVIPPAVLSDEGRIFRVSIVGGGMNPHRETIRIAPAGDGGSAVDLSVEEDIRGLTNHLFERLHPSGITRKSLEATADETIARLQRGDLRSDAAERARDETRRREYEEMRADVARREAESPSFATEMAKARVDVNREVAQHPITVTVEVLTLSGESRYKRTV